MQASHLQNATARLILRKCRFNSAKTDLLVIPRINTSSPLKNYLSAMQHKKFGKACHNS